MDFCSSSISSSGLQKNCKSKFEFEFFIFNFSSSGSGKKTKFIEFEFAALVDTKTKIITPNAKTLKNGLKTYVTA